MRAPKRYYLQFQEARKGKVSTMSGGFQLQVITSWGLFCCCFFCCSLSYSESGNHATPYIPYILILILWDLKWCGMSSIGPTASATPTTYNQTTVEGLGLGLTINKRNPLSVVAGMVFVIAIVLLSIMVVSNNECSSQWAPT